MKIGAKIERCRLYNAGDAIEEALHYSLPDGHDPHCVAKFRLFAPAKDFFFVPQIIEVKSAQGESVPILARFAETVLREDRWGARGVVLIDPEFKEKDPDEPDDRTPIAATDKEAIAKAVRILERWEKGIVQMFIDQCNEARAKGMAAVGAKGKTKALLEKYGVADPSQAVLIKTGETQSEIEQLKKQLEQQQLEFNRKLAELVASLAQPGAKGNPAHK